MFNWVLGLVCELSLIRVDTTATHRNALDLSQTCANDGLKLFQGVTAGRRGLNSATGQAIKLTAGLTGPSSGWLRSSLRRAINLRAPYPLWAKLD